VGALENHARFQTDGCPLRGLFSHAGQELTVHFTEGKALAAGDKYRLIILNCS